jgi:cytidylate kinase
MAVWVVITGLPGVGKTSTAIALGEYLSRVGMHPFLLHTDLLKVTLRQFAPEVMGGITNDRTYREKIAYLHPFLERHYQKAQRDGYSLIIEGTLAIAFQPTTALYVVLTLPEAERQRRIQLKHPSARQSLAQQELSAYGEALQNSLATSPNSLTLVADGEISTTVGTIVAALGL